MFSKLKKQININKNHSNSKSPVQTPKKSKSYTEMCLQTNRNYQITWIADHIFQGAHDKNKNKHGEGVLIMDNGLTVIGSWLQGKLHGQAIIATPFSALVFANFHIGKLQGWTISKYKDNIEIQHFTNDKSTENTKIIYQGFEGLWVKSIFNEQRQFKKVLQLQKAKDLQLPSFVRDQQLEKMFSLVFKYKKFITRKKRINYMRIDKKFQYYGFIDSNNFPSGLGILFSQNQMYMGNFDNGCLHKYGLILFQSGTIYKGDMNKGRLKGQGIFYSPNTHQSKLVRIDDDEVQCILSEKQGFSIQNFPFPFTIGKTNYFRPFTGFSDVIVDICEEISRFYYRKYSINENQQYQQDQDEQEQRERFASNEFEPIVQYADDSLDMEEYSSPGRKKNSPILLNRTNFQSNSQTKKQKFQEGPKVRQRAEKKLLSYEQIIKKSIKKIDYPHLKQFDISPEKKKATSYKYKQKPGIIYNQKNIN